MADVISLDLELTDKVSKPARAAAQALRQVEAAQERAQRSVTRAQTAFANAWDKVGSRAARDQERSIVKASVVQMKATQKAMKEEQRFAKQQERDTRRMGLLQLQAQKINDGMNKKKGFLGGFKDAMHVPALTKAAFWGELAAKGVESVVGGFVDGAKAAVSIIYGGVKEAFSAGAQREQLATNYKLLLGKSGGQAALAD